MEQHRAGTVWQSGEWVLLPQPLFRYLWELVNGVLSGIRIMMMILVAPLAWLQWCQQHGKETEVIDIGQIGNKVGGVVDGVRASSESLARALRVWLLPAVSERNRGKLTVVLDLDETLIVSYPANLVPATLRVAADRGDVPSFELLCDHGTGKRSKVAVFARPGLSEFLARLSHFAEVILFTAGVPSYAEPLMGLLDPKRTLFSGKLYRDSTVQSGRHNHVKDLSRLGRDLRRTVIVDNSPFSFLLQPSNGIPCAPFRGQPSDMHLLGVILPLLECLSHVQDIRPVLNNHFKMARWFRSKGCDVPISHLW